MKTLTDSGELKKYIIGNCSGSRHIIAIAGAPAGGKSSLAEWLVKILNSEQPGSAVVLPMDGYHFDDSILISRGLLARKGSPDTFDLPGLANMFSRLKSNKEEFIAAPLFDRRIEIARAGALVIEPTVKYIVAEGNYLLLNEAGWRDLREYYDITVLVDIPEVELRIRLRKRWIDIGLNEEGIRKKIEENDIPNGKLVMENSVQPNILFRPDVGNIE